MAKLRAVFHYAASPGIAECLPAAESDWLSMESCDEGDDARLFRLSAEANVIAVQNSRRLIDGGEFMHRVA